MKVQFKQNTCICEFFIVDRPTTILGLVDAEKLGLLTIHCDAVKSKNKHDDCTDDYIDDCQSKPIRYIPENTRESIACKKKVMIEYGELFEGVGRFSNSKPIHIMLQDNAVPYIAPVHRVAQALQQPLKKGLDCLVDLGIIRKLGVDETSEWVNSFVCVKKPNGKIHLCLDPTQLNKWIKCPIHDVQLVDDILPKLAGAKWFTIIDSTSSFWTQVLDKGSSLLTTFNTMYGRYCYLHLPMGVNLSSDVYQYQIDQTFENVKQCTGIADDLIIWGFDDNGDDHDKTLREVLNIAKTMGMHFNPDKCIFKQKKIPFFGILVGENGIERDPQKIADLKSLPIPTTAKLLQSFLGIVNYLARFSPNIAKLTEPLRQLP